MFMLKSTHEAAHASLKERLATAETERDEWRDKFKLAISDLEEIAYERDELRPDALAHRARLKRDREQKAAKRAASR